MSSPSIVPEHDRALYFVMCDYGPAIGRAFVETDPEASDRETIIQAIAKGHYTKVAEVLAVDISAGTVRNVTKEIMSEVLKRSAPDKSLLNTVVEFNRRPGADRPTGT